MSKQKLKFNDTKVNKKKFYASNQAIPLNSVNTNNIIISYRVKGNDNGLLVIYMMMQLDPCVLFYLK